VPKSYDAAKPAPLLVMLHGAGGSGERTIGYLTNHADRLGLIIVAPSSAAATWDMIASRGRYGPDVAALDGALSQIFADYRVDPDRVAIGGFSDGASYALSVGLMNGNLFRRIVAFSPGFMSPLQSRGKPDVFISHGRRDDVLPIDVCSRRIVPRLEAAGHRVDYQEFDGGHLVPEDLARRAYNEVAVPPPPR
jgi:phospholipase/carboxylesterase